MSVRTQILVSFFFGALLVTVVTAGYMYQNFRKLLLQRATADISNILTEEKQNLNQLMQRIKSCGDSIALNEFLVEAAISEETDFIKQNSVMTAFYREIQMVYGIYTEMETGEYGLSFYLNPLLPMSKHALPGGFSDVGNANGLYNAHGVEQTDWYQETLRQNGELFIFKTENANEVCFAKKIKVIHKKTEADFYFGVMVLRVDFRYVLNKLEKKSVIPGMNFVITDQNGSIISKSSREPSELWIASLLAENTVTSYRVAEMERDGYLVDAVKTQSDFQILSFTPMKNIIASAVKTGNIIMVAALLALFLLILLSYFFSLTLSKPLKRLVQQLGEIKGENIKPLTIEKQSNAEIEGLYQAINSLIRRIEDLLKDIVTRSQREKKLEFMMYQLRINPHFLYNTLDSIFWKAVMTEQQEIADMAHNLSKIFEYSIRGDGMQASLAEETEILECYVELQRRRYTNPIAFSADIDSCTDIKIPKCLLQPLIENAIIHGMNGQEALSITLRAEPLAGGLTVLIRDNGKGSCADKLNAYLSGDASLLTNDEMGISNVSRRIRFAYGENSGLRYENNPEGGMTAMITILQNKEGEENEL